VEPDPVSEKRAMLVIDSEGISQFNKSNNRDMRIFGLVVLLSSTLIYNSVGGIDEDDL
jgi:hypothetical protein